MILKCMHIRIHILVGINGMHPKLNPNPLVVAPGGLCKDYFRKVCDEGCQVCGQGGMAYYRGLHNYQYNFEVHLRYHRPNIYIRNMEPECW